MIQKRILLCAGLLISPAFGAGFSHSGHPGTVKQLFGDGFGEYCAIDTADHLYCWDEAGIPIKTPIDHAKSVSMGTFWCAIQLDDRVSCWKTGETEPFLPPQLQKAKSISVDSYGICGIALDGKAYCQSGSSHPNPVEELPSQFDHYDEIQTLFAEPCLTDKTGRSICKSGWESAPKSGVLKIRFSPYLSDGCWLLKDGTIRCFGGDYDSKDADPPPSGAFTDLSVGASSACGVTATHELSCWTFSNCLHCRHGIISPPPIRPISIVSGYDNACAILEDHTVLCWGKYPAFNPFYGMDDDSHGDSYLIATQAKAGLIRVSSDPYSTSGGDHASEVEPSSFAYGDTIVAGFQVGRHDGGGATNIGWATSKDGGKTWTHGFLPGTTAVTGGKYPFASDVCVAYSAKHNVWMMSLFGAPVSGLGNPLLISRSTDGGMTWNNPIELQPTVDGTGLVCDNSPTSKFFGRCYAFHDWGGNVSTSDDGGVTWTAKHSTPNLLLRQFAFPGVLPDGTVFITQDSISFSHDGGETWSAPVVSNPNRKLTDIVIRADSAATVTGVDRDGNMYRVDSDCQFEPNCYSNGLSFVTSHDRGQSWTPATRIPLEPNEAQINHFNATLGVDPQTSGANAHLAVSYYYMNAGDCSDDCQVYVGFISSIDGGKTWSAPITLAGPMNVSWLTVSNPVGDYASLSFSNGVAVPFFALAASAPVAGKLDEAIYTNPQPVSK